MKTWNYKGTQSGFKTWIQRYADGGIVIHQVKDAGLPPNPENCTTVVFNEAELRKILKDKKRFPRKKLKRGKK